MSKRSHKGPSRLTLKQIAAAEVAARAMELEAPPSEGELRALEKIRAITDEAWPGKRRGPT